MPLEFGFNFMLIVGVLEVLADNQKEGHCEELDEFSLLNGPFLLFEVGFEFGFVKVNKID